MLNLDALKEYKEFAELVVLPIILVLIPSLYTIYFKLAKKMREIRTSFSIKNGTELKDWETNFSRMLMQSIGFYLDGIDINPYCMTDQIMYLGLEDGVIGPSRIHSMYMSLHAENSGPSRLPKKATAFQRVPYASLNGWCAELDKQGVLKIPDVKESRYSDIALFDTARSFIAMPIYTKEHWFAGVVLFNYLDVNFNNQTDTSKDEEYLHEVKTYIEGQMLQMDLARMAFMKEHHIN